MKKGYKKLFLLVAIISMLGSLLAACSGSKETSKEVPKSKAAVDDYKVGSTFKAKEPLTFSFLYSDHPNYPLKKDWLLFEEIKKRTNVTLDPTIVPMSDYEQKRSLLMSSGNAPLIIPKTYPGQEAAFVSSGVILPVSDYVDKMPHFKDFVEKYDLQADLDTLRQEDGKYYVLPGMHEKIWPDYSLAIRNDIFEKNNIAIPTTWAELQDSLSKLKEIYPDIIPYSDRWQLKSTLNFAAGGFGTKAGWGYNGVTYNAKKDKFVYTGATDQYKEMVTYFNGLVKDGLLDKESLTQDDQQAIQKFVSGKSFVIATNGQELISMRKSMDETLGKGNYSITKIMVPGGPAGQVLAGTRLENGLMISSKAKEDPNFEAMLQFVDWLWYSPEAKEFTKWGVEGVTYTKDSSGKRTLTSDVNYVGLNPAGTKMLNAEYGFSGGVFSYGGPTELVHSMFNEEELAFQKTMAETKKPLKAEPPYPLSSIDREQATLLSTPLKDHTDQDTLQFILGTRPLSEWDKHVEELKAKGMDKYVDLVNKSYEAYKKKAKK
jgi:putative aldouronate transport system substrate-binding protein